MSGGFSDPDPADVPDDDGDDAVTDTGGFQFGDGGGGGGDDGDVPPDRPRIPEDPPGDVADMIDGDAADLIVADAGVSCEKCAHFDVCAIYKGFLPLMSDWHTDDPPVDPDKLALHCDRYDPDDGDGAAARVDADQ